jgi:hypothetical protein
MLNCPAPAFAGAGSIAQNHGIAEKFVRLNAAPQCPFRGDPDRLGRNLQRVEAEPVEMCLPGGLVAEPCLRFGLQTGDRGRGQALVSHVVVSVVVEHVVSVAGAEQVEEVQPALRRPRAEPGKPLIADLRAKAVRRFMPRAGVVHRYPRRRLQSGAQHVPRFGHEVILLVGQQPLDLTFGDRQADRLQQGRKTGQCCLALMILHQHEAAQVRAEVPLGPLGQRRDDSLSVRCHPTFTLVTDRMHRQHELLNQIGFVALEARSRRGVRFQHAILDADTRPDLAAARTLL